MEWVLDHLQIIIAVAAAIAYWLNQRRQGHADDTGDMPTQMPPRDFNADPEEEARTRRIQDEIRRKIAERAAGGPINVPPPAAEPPPLFRTESPAPRPVATPLPQREFTREAVPPPVLTPPTFQANAGAILERQRELAEQLEALASTRRIVERKAAAIVAHAKAQEPSPIRGELMHELRGAHNLRRAMVLREVLGPPVGLR
jgi:hypothetical protein